MLKHSHLFETVSISLSFGVNVPNAIITQSLSERCDVSSFGEMSTGAESRLMEDN